MRNHEGSFKYRLLRYFRKSATFSLHGRAGHGAGRSADDRPAALLARQNPAQTLTRVDEGFHQTQQKHISSATVPRPAQSDGHADLLSALPVHVAYEILLFCDASTLAQVSRLSKHWHMVSGDNLLWRNLCRQRAHWNVPCRGGGDHVVDEGDNDHKDGGQRDEKDEHEIGDGIGERRRRSAAPIDYRSLFRRRTLMDERWKNGEARSRCVVGHEDSIYCIQFDAKRMVTGSRDRTIKFWDFEGHCVRTLRGHHASVLCLQFDHELMVSGSSDHTVLLWSMQSYTILRELRGHTSGVLDVSFDATYVASCSKDTSIRIWDRATGALLRTLQGHQGPVNAIQFKGTQLVSASGDAIIKLWDLSTGECLRDFVGHARGLACIQFDGHRIVSGSNDNNIKVWNADTGECIMTCEGHTGLVRALHFNQTRIVSGSYDQSIRIWDLETGACLHHFPTCHSSWVFDVMFDDTKIISTSQDRRILIMDFAHGLDTHTTV